MKNAAIELAVRDKSKQCKSRNVDTPINDIDSFTEEQKQKDISNYPLKRYGLPNDVAWGIIYLLSDASSWVTGTSLKIDGGYSL